MTTNQKVTPLRSAAATQPESKSFFRGRAWLAQAAVNLRERKQIAFELSLLGDRALADIGLRRSDIAAFARAATKPGPKGLLVEALVADFSQIWQAAVSRASRGHARTA